MTLFLLPNFLSREAEISFNIPQGTSTIVEQLDGLIAEDAKAGRTFLKRLLIHRKVADVPVVLLNEHTRDEEIHALLQPLLKGQTWGLVSDAGLPCLADPGSKLVRCARVAGLQIRAIPGPCSIIEALMLSGLSAQKFAFHGYLPRDVHSLTTALQTMEQRAHRDHETQVFIETPYRNQRLLQHLLEHLGSDMILSIACDLTAPTEEVFTKNVKEWKAQTLPSLDNRPAVFLFAPTQQRK